MMAENKFDFKDILQIVCIWGQIFIIIFLIIESWANFVLIQCQTSPSTATSQDW